MLRDIIRKEIQESISTPRMVFAFLLSTVLVLFSVYVGLNSYSLERREYETAVATNRSNIENIKEWRQLLDSGGTIVARPPQPLSFMISGVQPTVGKEARVTVWRSIELTRSKSKGNPLIAIFGRLDLTFAVRVVLSLLAIIFSYNALSGEKEQGTLKLILAQPVPRSKLLLGKTLGGLFCLGLALAVPLLLSLILVSLHPDVMLSGEDWMRLGLILVFYLLYISVFFALGLFVSSRLGSSALSLLVLLFAWVVSVSLIPQAAVMAAAQLRQVPSAQETAARKSAFSREQMPKEQETINQWSKKNPPPGGDYFNVEWRARQCKELQIVGDRLHAEVYSYQARLDEEYRSRLSRQQSLAMWLSRLSPSACLMYGSMSLGQTGLAENERFLDSVRSYRQVFTEWGNRMMWSRTPENTPMADWNKPRLDGFPEFKPNSESLAGSLRAALPDFLSLVFMIVLLFAGAYVAFIRCDVR